jgi:regulator of replication initiation timing
LKNYISINLKRQQKKKPKRKMSAVVTRGREDKGNDTDTDTDTETQPDAKEQPDIQETKKEQKTKESRWSDIEQLFDRYGGNMQTAMQKLLDDSNSLLEIIAKIEAERVRVQSELSKSKTEIEDTKMSGEKLKDEASRLKKETDNLRATVVAFQKQLEDAREQVRTATERNQSLHVENENLERSLQKCTQEFAGLRKEKEGLSADLTVKIAELNVRLKAEEVLYQNLIELLGAVNPDPKNIENIIGYGMNTHGKLGINMEMFSLSLLVNRIIRHLKNEKVKPDADVIRKYTQDQLDIQKEQLQKQERDLKSVLESKIAWNSLSNEHQKNMNRAAWDAMSSKEQHVHVGFREDLWNTLAEMLSKKRSERELIENNQEALINYIMKEINE